MKALVFNAGSSSLKFSLFEAGEEKLLAEGGIDWGTSPTRLLVRSEGHPETGRELTLRGHADAVARLIEALRGAPWGVLQGPEEVRGVGHRIVHGGMRFTEAVRITPQVRLAIGQLAPLAPLHNPASLEVIDAAGKPDGDVALAGSPGRILVIATREDLTIVREMRRLAHAGEPREVHVDDDRCEDQRKEFP